MNISRRQAIGSLTTGGALAIAAPGILLQTGCASKKQLVRWSITGLQILKDVSPTLTAMGATDLVALIDQATPYAEKLRQALEDNDNTSAGQLLENLLGAGGWMAQIADKVGLLKDEHQRNIIMGSLAIAQVAYRLISAQIQNDVPANVASTVNRSQPNVAATMKSAAAPNRLQQAFQATRF